MTLKWKRAIDIAGALVGLALCLPLCLFVSLTLLLSIGRPVFFRHLRAGYHARPFHVVKFRTMKQETVDRDGSLLSEQERMTSFTAFLRAKSIDEIPQLINVLKGEMSLVGPRPLLPEYLTLYTPEQSRRHEMRPGITGLAQVSGRQMVDFERRFELDVWYVDHWSLWLDLKIIVRTIKLLFSQSVDRYSEEVTGASDWTG